jgi:hypothetical protein
MRTRAAVEAAFADAPTFEVAGRRLGGVTKQRAAQIAAEFCIPSSLLRRFRRGVKIAVGLKGQGLLPREVAERAGLSATTLYRAGALNARR